MIQVLLERTPNSLHEGFRPGLDDLNIVLQALITADTKWHNIGRQLGLSKEELSRIGANYRLQKECLRETLSLWLSGVDPVPTWEGLVDALKNHTVKEDQLAKFVEENYCGAKVKYSDYLRFLYRNLAPQRMLQWPELPHYEFVTLAMIKQERVTFGKTLDKFVQSTLHGNIDDILCRKEEIDLEHMFHKDEANHKVVLIEGAPGVGKTMLVWHICREWGRNQLFTQFSIIVLATLRDFADQEVKSLTDVLSITCENPEDAQKVSSKMKACHGRGILFLLDGWDELPKEQQRNEKLFFRMLIEKPEMVSLDKAAVIVTSRPVSSGDLRKFVSLRVEIVGFTSSNIKKYFKTCLKSEEEYSKKLDKLLHILADNPLIESICYLPLNAAIVVYLFCACGYTLPSTYYELFKLLVYHCIIRYAEKSHGNLQHQHLTFEKLPEKIRKPFEQICKLAYLATKNNVMTFSSDTLRSFEVTEPLNHLGLMQSVKTLHVHGEGTTYHFLHLSLQELLAAYHISKMTPETRQVEVFKDLLHNPRFSAVFGFYAGFTKFKKEGIRDVVAEIVQKERKSEEKTLLVSLMNWLYEAQDPELCDFVQGELIKDQSGKANGENGVLDLRYTSLRPSDTLSVGYFLSTVGTTVGRCCYANLSCCSIEDHHIKFLVKGLSHHQSMSKACVEMNLSMNCIRTEGLEYIADFLKESPTIKALNLGRNKLGRNKLGRNINKLSHSNVCRLMEALTDNSSLTELDISESYLELTGEVGVSLQTMLKENKSLRSLDISHSRISCDCIADGLVQNSGLKILFMKYCNITTEGMRQISEAIQQTDLEELSIGPLEDDCIDPLTNALTSLRSLRLIGSKVTDKGLQILGYALQENNSLLELSLFDFQSVTSEGLKILGEQLKKNQTLKVLGLRLICRITTDSLKYFTMCLQQNSTLKLLALLEKHVEEVKETVRNINKRRQFPLKLESFGNLHMVSYLFISISIHCGGKPDECQSCKPNLLPFVVACETNCA